MQKDLLLHFEDVQPFLEELQYSSRQHERLLNILHDAGRRQQLQMELAETVDAGGPFVSKTYLLKKDGEIVVDAHTHLQEVATAAAQKNYPTAMAFAREFC